MWTTNKMEFEKAIEELKGEKKRKFSQSVDLVVNLKNFDVRKEAINIFIQLPNPTDKKICGFLTKKTKLVDSITKEEFEKFKTPKQIKHLAKSYDFFIAAAPLMGAIATKFGRVFGPLNKMPSPQGGIIPIDNDDAITAMTKKMKSQLRVKTKEKSVKVSIGKEDMPIEQLKENMEAVIHELENKLPQKKENIKNVLVKFTMSKPLEVKF